MRRVYFGADNIITSLGFTTEENADQIRQNLTGIRMVNDPLLYPGPVAVSRIDEEDLCRRFADYLNGTGRKEPMQYFSSLEKIFILSVSDVLKQSNISLSDPKTAFIVSTTKGNIENLSGAEAGTHENNRIHLWELAEYLNRFFNGYNRPVVISNACISGLVAIMAAARMIASGRYDHALVTGGDAVSEFIISGFQSFQALSPEPCRPFDLNRTGLSLGEGAGTLLLTADPEKAGASPHVRYLGGSTSNDANHISGPSRDGEGLYLSIDAAMKEAGVRPEDLDFISAHGTATPYNDEMESLALAWAGLQNVPVNSFKGYVGHTLGAAGLIETILSVYSIRNSMLFKSEGYAENGVSRPLNILTQNITQPVHRVLKTASGFGGCNAALVLGSWSR